MSDDDLAAATSGFLEGVRDIAAPFFLGKIRKRQEEDFLTRQRERQAIPGKRAEQLTGLDLGLTENDKIYPEEAALLQTRISAEKQAQALLNQLSLFQFKQSEEVKAEIEKEKRGLTIEEKKEKQKLDIKKKEAQPKALKSLESYDESLSNTIRNITDVLDDPKFNRAAGFLGRQESRVEGTTAYNIRATIDSIRSAVSLDQLTELRANSPTGGALGNVSDQEGKRLESSKQNIDPNQSPAKLRKALSDLRTFLEGSKSRTIKAYESDFGTKYGGTGGIIPGAGLEKIAPEVDQFMQQNPGSKFLGFE